MTEKASGGELRRFIGLVIMVISGLWMAFSGLCAVGIVGNMIVEARSVDANAMGWAVVVAIVSGLSAAAGYAVFVVGRGLFKS